MPSFCMRMVEFPGRRHQSAAEEHTVSRACTAKGGLMRMPAYTGRKGGKGGSGLLAGGCPWLFLDCWTTKTSQMCRCSILWEALG